MDISDEDIAKLVLGYLKSEKCKSAVKHFLVSSRHLRDISGFIQRSKHFITHVHGYCLTEMLKEYAKLYTIIIEHLEETSYPNEVTNRDMPSKLTYLLQNARNSRSTTPTLSPRSRSSTPVKQHVSTKTKPKRRLSHHLSIIEEQSPETICNVNATPLHELPGNDKVDGSDKKRTDREEESDMTTDNPEDKDDQEGSITQVLTETFLENRELQDKLVENINSVIQKPLDETIGCNITENVTNNELNSAIKAIVNKTEHDPVFERLLSDLIGPNECESGPDEQDKCTKNIDSHSPAKETHHSANISTPNERSTTESTVLSPKQITEPIISTAKKQIITMEGTKVDSAPKRNLTVNTNTGEVILYDGTLENYIKEPTNSISTATSVNSTCSSNLVLNTGLLMVQPPMVQQPQQSYLVWNGSQVVNVSVPQYKVNNLSEQDILNMPTVIVCDENQQATTTVVTNSTEELPTSHLKKIAPNGPLEDVPTPVPRRHRKASKKKKSSKKTTQTSSTTQNIQQIHIKVLKNQDEPLIPEIKQEVGHLKDPLKIEERETIENANVDDISNTKNENNKETDVPEGNACREEDNAKANSTEECKTTPKHITPNSKSVPNLRNGGTSTPKSGSHVRALDFNFIGTPRNSSIVKKQPVTSPKRKSPAAKSNQGKISKALFGSPSKNQKQPANVEKKVAGKSWDADLRVLVAGHAPRSPSPKKKKPPKRSHKKKENVLNKTEQDALAIENNLKSEEKNEQIINPEKTTESEEKNPAEPIQIVIQNDTDDTNLNEVQDLPFTLVNCNRAPRIKRKCNIDGNVKKEVIVTKVKEVKNLDICSNKMILSPSKLNANKRTLVENKIEDTKISETKIQIVGGLADECKVPLTPSVFTGNFGENELLTLNFEKTITPENIKIPNIETPVLKANRNLMPLLETPIKNDFIPIPKTPGIMSPINVKDTPLTKIFKEQFQGVDITSIETPKFPLTPRLAITPFNNLSYENRPTDYSTGSSYYQPSDTEQNKSLEQLIEDSRKEAKEKNTIAKKTVENIVTTENVNIQKEENLETKTTASATVTTHIVNKLTNFNKNVIGKKNLSLVSKTDTVSFEDTDSEFDPFNETENLSESDGEQSSTSNHSWDSKSNKNVTVIQNVKPTQSRYPLRSQNKKKPVIKDQGSMTKLIENDNKEISTSKEVSNEVADANIAGNDDNIKETNNVDKINDSTTQHHTEKELILVELEKKRLQTIALMKQPANVTKQKSAPKTSNATKQQNTAKQKSAPKPKQPPKKQPSKTATKKDNAASKKRAATVKNECNFNSNLNSDNSLFISPINLVEAQLENSTSSNGKETKLIEYGENLIHNLWERGIHLLPNKKKVQLDPPDDNSSTELLKVTSNNHDNNNTVCTVSSNVLPLKKRDSNKSFEIKDNKPTDMKIIEDKNKVLQEDLNLTDSFSEEIPQFDFDTKIEFDFKFVQDENKKSSKSLQDYDLKCLEKSYTVNVFIDELNKDIKRVLSVSPMDFILDMNPTDKVKIINMVSLKKFNPLNTLYTELVRGDQSLKPCSDLQTKSPLEDLYEDSSRKGVEKGKNTKRRRSIEGNKRTQMPTRKSNRSLSIDERKIKAKSPKVTKDLDLMDYAILGDPSRTPTSEQSTKRKASDQLESEKNKCPKLYDNLLSGLNVEHFLAQVHKE